VKRFRIFYAAYGEVFVYANYLRFAANGAVLFYDGNQVVAVFKDFISIRNAS
jgi:hypothetical protein